MWVLWILILVLCIMFSEIYFSISQGLLERRLETEAWLDLAKIYSDLDSWRDAEICIGKAKSFDFYFPRGWHTTGTNAATNRDSESSCLIVFNSVAITLFL